MSNRARSFLSLALALFLLNASLTFGNVWPTPAITWTGDLSIELAVFIVLFVVVSRRAGLPSRRALVGLTTLWLLMALGRYADVTAPALWGREINLFWDLRFVPDVAAMLARAADTPHVAAVVAIALVSGVVLFAMVLWALGRLSRAMANPGARTALALISAGVIGLFIGQKASSRVPAIPRFSTPVVATYARQAAFVASAVSGSHPLPPSPSFDSDLSLINRADVLLVFMESYGAVTFERPEFAAALEPRRAELEEAIRSSGHRVVSAYVESPTFGGSSWFAHITLLSGIEVRNPDVNALLMTEHRDTLSTMFARRGYRTVAMMPGLWYPWPEGAFYGFNETYNGERLGYQGPPFGWWTLPDQFAFAKLDELELTHSVRAPVFAFFPTVSTHTPFRPTPPYQPDWARMLTNQPFDMADLDRAYADQPDWLNLGPSYVAAVSYAYTTLGGFVARHRGDDFVLIVIGDHQPPALVSGEGAPWDVPVHVITANGSVLDRLRSSGFRDGLSPRRPSLGHMDALLPMLVHAFGNNTEGARQARAE